MRLAAATALVGASLPFPLLADTLEPGDPADLFTVEPIVPGLQLPTSFVFLPDGRILITQKTGEVLVADASGQTELIGMFAVDSRSEKGLLNVLVHPAFATNRRLIFYYSAADSIGGATLDRNRVATVPLDAAGMLDLAGETILVRNIRGPANHDGGAIAIGPDGKLYVGVGDSGCNSQLPAEPPYTPTNYFATCLSNPNGKILRVNLDGTIPSDNPLVGKSVTACGPSCGRDVMPLPVAAAREEIWAWGFRNPWRFSFDARTGNLWVADVGGISYEEVNVIPPTGGGKHYGWPWREGPAGHPMTRCRDIVPDAGDCVPPAYSCLHGPGVGDTDGDCESVTGGVIVDSCEFPATFRGRYFYGDNGANWIAALDPNADRSGIVNGSRRMFARTSAAPVHFTTGPDGGLYYAVIGGPGASIQRVYPKVPEVCPPPSGSGGARGFDASIEGRAGAGGATSTRPDASLDGDVAQGGGTAAGGRAAGGGGVAPAGGGTSARSDSGTPADRGGGRGHDDGGCGCRMTGRDGAPLGSLHGLGALALLAARRLRGRRGSRRGALRPASSSFSGR